MDRKSFVKVTVTEDNVEEDVNSQQRWPVPIHRVTDEVGGSLPRLLNTCVLGL